MDFNRFTEKLQEATRAAQSLAVRQSHQQIDVEHLLAALLEQPDGLAASDGEVDALDDRPAAKALAQANGMKAFLKRRIDSALPLSLGDGLQSFTLRSERASGASNRLQLTDLRHRDYYSFELRLGNYWPGTKLPFTRPPVISLRLVLRSENRR